MFFVGVIGVVCGVSQTDDYGKMIKTAICRWDSIVTDFASANVFY